MSVENIKKLSVKIGQTRNFITGETIDIMKDESIKEKAKELNIKQMDSGVGSDGSKFGEYSYYSTIKKKEKGQFSDYIILKDTGKFRDSVFIKSDQLKANTPAMTFGASDPKWKSDIEPDDRFENALGLIDKNAEIIGGMIANELSKRISKFWKI